MLQVSHKLIIYETDFWNSTAQTVYLIRKPTNALKMHLVCTVSIHEMCNAPLPVIMLLNWQGPLQLLLQLQQKKPLWGLQQRPWQLSRRRNLRQRHWRLIWQHPRRRNFQQRHWQLIWQHPRRRLHQGWDFFDFSSCTFKINLLHNSRLPTLTVLLQMGNILYLVLSALLFITCASKAFRLKR